MGIYAASYSWAWGTVQKGLGSDNTFYILYIFYIFYSNLIILH